MRLSMVVAMTLMTVSASAQTPEATAQARALFERGMGHAQEERWVPALEAFRSSLEAAELPVTLFNVASVLMRLGRMQEAARTLERFVELTDDASELAQAQELLGQTRSAIRTLQIDVEPPDATLSLDGSDLSGSGAHREISVDPGTHALVIRAVGYEREERTITPDATSLEIHLSAQPAIVIIRASQADAQIFINGVLEGSGEARLELDAGRYTLRVDGGDDYAPFERELELEPGERMDVEASLSRDEPVYRRGWFWGVIAGTAVVIAASVTATVLLSGRESSPYGGTTGWVF